MAKSFLKQLLDFTGLQLPNADGQYHPSVYRDEPAPAATTKQQPSATTASGQKAEKLTGVEKYLAQKNPEPAPETAPAATAQTTGLTGVAKYLAKKLQEEQDRAEAEAKKLTSMTGVARYLAQLENADKPIPPAKPAAAPKTALTGVEKYLAQQKATVQAAPQEHKATPASAVKAETKAPVEKPKPATKDNKPTQAQQTAENKPEPAAPIKKEVAKKPQAKKLMDLAENATQCQAATLKGGQCRRKTSLETIEQTVNDQRYKFAVCSQHNNDAFTPFAKLLS